MRTLESRWAFRADRPRAIDWRINNFGEATFGSVKPHLEPRVAIVSRPLRPHRASRTSRSSHHATVTR